jgi:two-component system, NarL family, nitrate/nitrite response regulator NarL
MITDHDLGHLRAALTSLCAERESCAPWAALSSLGAMTAGRFQITIDMRAIETLGVPMVVARPLPSRAPELMRLSPREREVAARLALGLSNSAIAGELSISVATVKDHVHKILSKIGATSRNQIVAMLHAERGS